VIGRQRDAPGIVGQEHQLETAAHCTALTSRRNGTRAAPRRTRLALDVEVGPLAAGEAVQTVLRRRVGGERHRRSEHHLPTSAVACGWALSQAAISGRGC